MIKIIKLQNQVIKIASFQALLLFHLSTFSYPVQAQADVVESKCSSAIAQAHSRLEKGRNLQVVKTVIYQLDEGYTDYPKNSPYGIAFGMEGSAALNVLHSGKLMTTIAKDLISQCDSLSAVVFNRYRTDHNVSLGVIDGKVQGLECYPPQSHRVSKIPWGYTGCL